MPAVFAALVSAALVLIGGVSLYEYTLYTEAQKARAPRLSSAYLVVIVVMLAFGISGFVAAVVVPAWEWLVIGIVGIVAAASSIVQSRLHTRMNLESGPLATRFAEKWLDD